MFESKKCECLLTSVSNLIKSINVSADCRIECHLPGADEELINQLTPDTRILGIDDNTVTDSGELRELLMGYNDKDVVTVFYETTHEIHPPISIAASVEFDGSVSLVAPQTASESIMAQLSESEGSPQQQSPTATCPSYASLPNSRLRGKSEGDDERFSISSSDFMAEVTIEGMVHRVQSDPKMQNKSVSSCTPSLLEFDKMTMSLRADELSRSSVRQLSDSAENRVRKNILRALDSVEVGACVICVCQDVNPIAELELIAISLSIRITAINLGVKLRLRPKPEEFARQFKEAMNKGEWFALVNAHKSIATLRILEELVKDAQTRNFEGFNPASKIIICLEPHPHFPRLLMQRAAVTKIQSSLSGSISSSFFMHTLATSVSRRRLVMAESMLMDEVCRASCSTAGPKRRVRINAAVDIVDILPREVLRAPQRESVVSFSGSVALRAAFTGVANDKFFCISSAGEKGRFAVGSSMGNVYFVDNLGNSLLQAHAHDASIWDLSFCGKYRFATGCEDGNSTVWSFDTAGMDSTALVSESTTSLGNDVYCLTYLKGVQNSPLLIGGLNQNLVLRSVEGDVKLLTMTSNAQVMDTFAASPIVLVGGSDGSVTAVDVQAGTATNQFKEHSRKLPALTIRDENHFFTGSFDSTILSWDYRIPQTRPTAAAEMSDIKMASPTHTLKLKNYVTGLSVDDIHLAASVGENLYLWDVRKLSEVLGGYPQGWRGLSRGVIVNSEDQCVVTASQDGYVRFWQFV